MIRASEGVPQFALHEKWFYLCVGTICLGGVFLLKVVPLELLVFILVSGTCLAVGMLSFSTPVRLLYFVLSLSPIAGLIQSLGTLEIGKTDVSLSGVAWIFVTFDILAVMLSRVRMVSIPKGFYLLCGFTAWVVVRWLMEPLPLGLKDVLFYSFPLLVGVYAILVFSKLDVRSIEKVEQILLWSPWVPLAYFALTIPTGIVTFVDGAPRGPIDPRALASYLLIIAAFGFAKWRYDPTADGSRRGRTAGLLATLLIIFTLSRTATLIAVLLLGVSRMDRQRPRKALLSLALSGILAGLIFVAVPALGSRVFSEGSPDFSDGVSTDTINTEGRATFWAATFVNAIERPVVGWGLGSARLIVRDVFPGGEWNEYHPHNEYLQVFHDLGLVGILLLIGAWFSLIYRFWKDWRANDILRDRVRAKWGLASFLAILAILISVLTGNELHYAFVTGPTFVIIGVAMSMVKRSHSPYRQGI